MKQEETVMSAHCRLCDERTERDEAAAVGEHLVCGACCARVGVQAVPALRKMVARKRRRVTFAAALALAYEGVTDAGRV